MTRYTVVIDAEPDGSAYNVSVPSLAGRYTWGETIEEALHMAREAITSHIVALVEVGESIPVEHAAPVITGGDVDVPAA